MMMPLKQIMHVVLVVVLSWVVTACSDAGKSPEDRMRAELTRDQGAVNIGSINIGTLIKDEAEMVYCQIVVLMNPDEGLLMPSDTVNRLVQITGATAHAIYPEAVQMNLFISTRPDAANHKSLPTMDLDGVTLRLGMSRDEIRTELEGSDWRVVADMRDHWGLSARWPRRADVYFASEEEAAVSVFLVPAFNESGGGIRVISADLPLPLPQEPL